MFARRSIYEKVDLTLADQVKQWLEASDSDPCADLPGYCRLYVHAIARGGNEACRSAPQR